MKHYKSVKLGDPLKEKRLCITVTLGPFEVRYLHITTAVGESFESKVDHLYITVAVGPLWEQGTLHITVEKDGRRQVPRLPSLKHITAYGPDNDLIWEYETDWTRSASSDTRTFSPDARMQTL